MLGRLYDNETCSIARTLELIGERWSILILRNAIFGGTTRFSDFQRDLAIAPNILARRLEGFVSAGIMAKVAGGHAEYHLTPKGQSLVTVLTALRQWGDEYEAPLGPPVVIEHRGCGGQVVQKMHCEGCAETPDATSMIAKPTEAYFAYLAARAQHSPDLPLTDAD